MLHILSALLVTAQYNRNRNDTAWHLKQSATAFLATVNPTNSARPPMNITHKHLSSATIWLWYVYTKAWVMRKDQWLHITTSAQLFHLRTKKLFFFSSTFPVLDVGLILFSGENISISYVHGATTPLFFMLSHERWLISFQSLSSDGDFLLWNLVLLFAGMLSSDVSESE